MVTACEKTLLTVDIVLLLAPFDFDKVDLRRAGRKGSATYVAAPFAKEDKIRENEGSRWMPGHSSIRSNFVCVD